MDIGPRTREQFSRLARGDRHSGGEYAGWAQGEHVLVSGGTGSGKTALARHLDEIRIAPPNNGVVVVFVCKPKPDDTITKDYKGWTRWTDWKSKPGPHENRILLWPDLRKEKTIAGVKAAQRDIFGRAMDDIYLKGKWTVHVDEGLYLCHPSHLGLADELANMHAMGRSSKLTLITLTQRPSHLPLIIYSSASHAFIGRTREAVDAKRLSELGASQSAKELSARIASQGRHDFLWVPVAPDWEPETMNLRH